METYIIIKKLSSEDSVRQMCENKIYTELKDPKEDFLNKIYKSSCPEVFCKKGVLRNFTKFTGKHLCQSLFFNKVAGLRLQPEHLKSSVPLYKFCS